MQGRGGGCSHVPLMPQCTLGLAGSLGSLHPTLGSRPIAGALAKTTLWSGNAGHYQP